MDTPPWRDSQHRCKSLGGRFVNADDSGLRQNPCRQKLRPGSDADTAASGSLNMDWGRLPGSAALPARAIQKPAPHAAPTKARHDDGSVTQLVIANNCPGPAPNFETGEKAAHPSASADHNHGAQQSAKDMIAPSYPSAPTRRYRQP